MKQITLLKNQYILNVIIMTVLIIGVLCSIYKYNNYKEYIFYNNARLLAAEQLNQVQACFTDKNFQASSYQKGSYPVVITNINGVVLYSEKEEYNLAEKVNVNEFIQIDHSLFLNGNDLVKTTFAIESSETTVGFVAFYIPRESTVGMKENQVVLEIFKSIIFAGFFVCVLLLFNQRYIKYRIIRPVAEMIESSKAIIDGDYNVPVVKAGTSKLMSNDVDRLSYNFELMRDELKEKRRREEDLKRSQKELISCISHDFKTPISTIKAYGEGLRDGMAKDADKVQKYADIIVLKTDLLTKMINDLLDHFNAELNQLSIVKKEQYFNDFLNKLSKEIKGVADYKQMEYFYENTAPNLLVDFDENRITQVITNLVDNSIKYGKNEDGKIGIQVSYVQEKDHILIGIWDNGYGIGVSDIPFVFDMFYRGEKSRNMSIPGSGLGLSICKYIIEEHGGEIWCESRKNEGTHFMICLPV